LRLCNGGASAVSRDLGSGRKQGELAFGARARALERRERRAGETRRRHRLRHGRVDRRGVAVHLEMQVRAGGEPGRADAADHLALADERAGPEPALDRGEVGIERGDAAGVGDHDRGAVVAAVAGDGDAAVARGEDRRASGRGEIHPLVHAAVAEDGVAAHAEARGDARRIERGAEQRPPHRDAVLVEPAGRAAGLGEAPDPVAPAALLERRIERLAMVDQRAVWVAPALEHHREAVPRLDVALEVEAAREGAYQPHDQRRRHRGAYHVLVEARRDRALGAHEMPHPLDLLDGGGEAAVLARDHGDPPVRSGLDGEGGERAVGIA